MQSDAIIVNYLKVALGSSGGGANMNFLKSKFIFALSPVVAQVNLRRKICYQLSARELSIAWGNCPLYWSWKPVEGSRFEEAAELRTICWLEMNGSISTGMLSPKTLYGAYLKVKIADRAYGLDSLPSHVSVELPNYKSHGTVYIRRPSHTHSHAENEEWLEIELGSFYTGLDKEVVRMGLKEVKGVHLKGGLIVDGIEIRPKNVPNKAQKRFSHTAFPV
ncbi:F-box protein [Arachis hypogaea]|nr:F-box protein [Arachis hypogaea]